MACPYYGGHIDIEGKIGSKRDLGEISLFMPVRCSRDSLLYADLRLKRDNADNKEGNWGLGFRQGYETGILGHYFYIDRKISGITDKYHTQLTFGSEWLAESWEVRANAYLPVTGEKSTSAGSVLSGVNLSGNNIYIEQSAGSALIETPLYGGDIEAGFQIPDTRFWLHAGAFSFHGDDVDPVNGGRVRARYDLTDNISLNAEGQYDGMRGRQGWLGVRFTIPFGGPAKKPEKLAARMTASPVRDVDIVTQTRTKKIGENKVLTVLNTDTGDAQRILYVDNSFTGVEEGTKEAPFKTLAAAQARLDHNDIVYVYHGDGLTTGMDSGFQLNRDNVMLVGSGADLIYDSGRFSLGGAASSDSIVLIPKGLAPTITNTGLWNPVLNITGRDATVAGVNITGAQSAAGIHATANNVNLGTLTIRDVDSSGNDGFGLNIYASGGSGRFDHVILQNVVTNANTHNGTRISAENGTIGSIDISNLVANDNIGPNGVGLHIVAFANGEIENVMVEDVTTSNNEFTGFSLAANGAGSIAGINSVTIDRLISENNAAYGIYIASGGAQSTLGSTLIQNSIVRHNAEHGVFYETYGGGTATNILRNTLVTQNQKHGVRLYKDSTDIHNVDLGTASDYGMNILLGNGLSAPAVYGDLANDMGGAGSDATAIGNWWGLATGPTANQIKGGGAVDTDPALNIAP